MTTRLNIWLAALLLVFGLPYYWLMLDSRPGDAKPMPLSMSELRSLAAGKPGQRPTAITMEVISARRLPGNLLASGIGLKRRLYGVVSYRLDVPNDAGPVVIDAGITRKSAVAEHMELFRADAQARVERSLRRASLIVTTAPDADHIGGLAETGAKAVAIRGEAPRAVATGIVVIPTPEHAPGSRMVYVQLANGGEYLFTGDIAPLAANWAELRVPSRLMSAYWRSRNRAGTFAWLRTIAALKAEAKGLRVVPGHDPEAVRSGKSHLGIRYVTPMGEIAPQAAGK